MVTRQRPEVLDDNYIVEPGAEKDAADFQAAMRSCGVTIEDKLSNFVEQARAELELNRRDLISA